MYSRIEIDYHRDLVDIIEPVPVQFFSENYVLLYVRNL